MAIFPGSAIPSAVSAYDIDNSCRFDGTSAYLNKTFASAGNQQIFTISVWAKRSKLGASQNIFDPVIGGDGANESQLYFTSGDKIQFYDSGGNRGNLITAQVFRDPSAWYHIVIAVDTTQAVAANRIKMYVNGEVAALSTATYPAQDVDLGWGAAVLHRIAARTYSTVAQWYGGYLAELYFTNGTPYDADDFGELNATTNQWVPKDAVDDLTFGTNGFYQKYGGTELAIVVVQPLGQHQQG